MRVSHLLLLCAVGLATVVLTVRGSAPARPDAQALLSSLVDRVWNCDWVTDASGTKDLSVNDSVQWTFSSRTKLLTESLLKEGEVCFTATYTFKLGDLPNQICVHHATGELYLHFSWEVDAGGLTVKRIAPAPAQHSIGADTYYAVDPATGNDTGDSVTLPAIVVDEAQVYHFVPRDG